MNQRLSSNSFHYVIIKNDVTHVPSLAVPEDDGRVLSVDPVVGVDDHIGKVRPLVVRPGIEMEQMVGKRKIVF